MSKFKSSNPFEDDEDDEDFIMVNKQSTSGKTAGGSTNNRHLYSDSDHGNSWNKSGDDNPFDDRRQNIQRQIDNSENSQLESTQRALASIYESEAMGIATAEELVRQGETVDRIENKTTGIQNTLKTSQRHLNNIKSVFGGIKNWWKGDKNAAQEEAVSTNSRARLQNIVEKSEHQVERPRADYRGFYEDNDNDLDAKFMAKAPKASSPTGGYSMISPVTRTAREEELDHNIGMMSDGMSRLKSLAMGLGDEIEQQNEQLSGVILKVEDADGLVSNQNAQMRKILKK